MTRRLSAIFVVLISSLFLGGGIVYYGGTGGGANLSYPLLAPDGTKAAESYAFTSAPSAGLSYDTFAPGFLNVQGRQGSGTDATGGAISINAGQSTGVGNGGTVFMSVTPPGSASNATLNTYQTVASFRYDSELTLGGVGTVGAPGKIVAQGGFRAVGQTDGAGGDAWLAGGKGTGTGAGGSVFIKVATPAASTGSTQNLQVTAIQISGADGSTTIGAPTTSGTTGQIFLTARAFANLGTPANGAIAYCNDCTITATCGGSGNGALAKRLNGVWVCN